MRVRARIGRRIGSLLPRTPVRRLFIYPHRSVRVVPITAFRGAVALGAAFLMTLGMAFYSGPIFRFHAFLVSKLLEFSDIPVENWQPVPLYSLLAPAPSPDLYI